MSSQKIKNVRAPDRPRTDPNPTSRQRLANCLRRRGCLPDGDLLAVQVKARFKHHLALRLTYSDDAPAALPRDLIGKWYAGDHPYGSREGLFYDQLAPAMDAPPVPACYGVDVARNGATLVLLADLSSTHLVPSPPYDDLSTATFERVMAANAQIHAHWWDGPRIAKHDVLRDTGLGVAHEAISAETIRANRAYFIEEALPARIHRAKGRFPAEWRPLCERAIAAWADLFVRRIAAGSGLTLIQGDAQLGNSMLPRDPQRHSAVLIDWEGCTRGLGAWDLARTWIQAGLPPERRQAIEDLLLPRYQARLAARGVAGYTIEQCRADYRLSVLANVPHALVWEDHAYLQSAIRAFHDWHCDELLT